MKVTLLGFGSIEIDGREYTHDVVIDAGEIRKRNKKASKARHGEYGHTPLSLAEDIPWGGSQLIVGTGVDAALPILAEVRAEAERRGIELVAMPTEQAGRLIEDLPRKQVHAVLHVTC